MPAIRGPRWILIASLLGQALYAAPIRPDGVDMKPTPFLTGIRDPIALRGPSRGAIVMSLVGQPPDLSRGYIHDIDLRTP